MFDYLPDPEQAIIDKLTPLFPGVPIGTREPLPRPAKYIKIFIGGAAGDVPATYESFTLTVETWVKGNETAANRLAGQIRKIIMGWGWGYGATLQNEGVKTHIQKTSGPRPISYPPGDGYARYTATYQLSIKH